MREIWFPYFGGVAVMREVRFPCARAEARAEKSCGR